MIKRTLRELYMLPRGEQRALLLLSLLLILGIVVRATVQLMPVRDPPGTEDFVKESMAIIACIERIDSLSHVSNYTSVTGRSLMSPLSVTARSPMSSFTKNSGIQVHEFALININTSDSVDLLPLPGIGPVFAGRIIRYRNLLGGFTRLDQLHEVYGLKSETIKLISENIVIDSLKIRKMYLDSISFGELLRHPYLQLEEVNALVKYREFKGRIDSIEEISNNNLLPDSTLEKVSPYLQFGR